MQIITTAIIKGGTGKTTTAAALAQAAATRGRKVLVIDLDPQANLTYTVGADAAQAGSVDLLNGAPVRELIQTTAQGIDAIAANPNLAIEKTKAGSAVRLREAIEPIKKRYDYIFIDTPPTIGEMTFNALQAATGLIIPLETDNNALQGLYQITDIAHQMQRTNPRLKVLGSILTRYDRRPNINRYMRDQIAEKGAEAGAPLLLEIRPGVAIREAQALRLNLYEYAPKSNPAADYLRLFDIIDGSGKKAKKA